MTNDRMPVEIPFNKTKLLKLLFISLLFFAGGLWIIITDPQTSNGLFNNPVMKALAGYGGVLMGLLGTYFFSKKLFDKKAGLILDENGITDNISAFSVGVIAWSDIVEVYEQSVQASIASKQRFITIGLKDPESYILRETNSLKQRLLRMNLKSYGSPIHITTNGLKLRHAEILQLLREGVEKYRAANTGV